MRTARTPDTPPAADGRSLSEETRERIRRAIVGLFSEGLFHDVGIRDICRRTGVAPKTIYKYFGNKEELLLTAIEPDLRRLTNEMEQAASGTGEPAERLAAVAHAFVSFYFRNLPIARIVFLNIPAAYFVAQPAFVQSRQLDVLERLIQEGQAGGSIRSDVTATELVEALAGISMRTMIRWLSTNGRPRARVATERLSQVAAGLLAPHEGT